MPFTRRHLLVRAGALAAAPALAGVVPRAWAAPEAAVVGAPPLSDADYLALADRIMRRLDSTWRAERRAYFSGGDSAIYNGALLTVHAVAAAAGHTGPARDDARARVLVERLCASPPFFDGTRLPHPDKMFHTPGWVAELDRLDGPQDKSIDPKVAEGLVAAWRAREALGLSRATVERIADRVDRVARARFFRYPNVRLNQINWNAELYAFAATVTGDLELLRRDYRRHLRRFVAGVRRPLIKGGTTNLGPSYRFHYLPHFPEGVPMNLDSAEYANITLHALHAYEPALAAGMAPLPEADVAILRAWLERVLFGYWTHSGMLNWDSGLGFDRWMKSKTWAYAQQGLLAIARARRFHRDPAYGPWAKHVFDRGLSFYERLLPEDERQLPSAHLYGVTAVHQRAADARIFSARMAANAVRAVTSGLGTMPAPEPPAFYAFDADIGRLAVSTPRYGTAVVAESRGAFPYGGLELARLFDAAGAPVGGLGGHGDAAFGIVVRGAAGRLASQSPRRGARSLVLSRSPRGRAGPFRELEAVGHTAGRDATITTRHRFTATFVETEWTIRRRSGRPPMTVQAHFPSYGHVAAIRAIHTDGRISVLHPGGAPLPLAGITRFELRSRDGLYVVTVLEGSGSARALRVARQPAAPHAGPTLALQPRRSTLRVRLAPA